METITKGKFIYLVFYLNCIAYLAKYYIKITMYIGVCRGHCYSPVSVLNIMAQEIADTTATSMEMIVQVKCYATIHISL